MHVARVLLRRSPVLWNLAPDRADQAELSQVAASDRTLRAPAPENCFAGCKPRARAAGKPRPPWQMRPNGASWNLPARFALLTRSSAFAS
jgi:hypothetical protein